MHMAEKQESKDLRSIVFLEIIIGSYKQTLPDVCLFDMCLKEELYSLFSKHVFWIITAMFT